MAPFFLNHLADFFIIVTTLEAGGIVHQVVQGEKRRWDKIEAKYLYLTRKMNYKIKEIDSRVVV